MSPPAANPGGKSSSPPSDYNLEFRSPADDAWYAARAILEGKKLTVKCGEGNDVVFEPQSFSDLDELRDFESRFRSVSRKLQGSECKQLAKGTAVCVSHSFNDNDNRFYDAVVDDVVIKTKHSVSNGKEVCKCIFAVVWQSRPWKGCIWHKRIDDIRIVQSGSELDPDVIRFLNMARKEIAASSNKEDDDGVDQPVDGTRPMEEDLFLMEVEDDDDDDDDGEEDADFGGRRGLYAILLDNLERGISSSALKHFIRQETSLKVEVHVSSKLFPETFTKAVIVADSEKQLDELCKLLDSPTQIVVSEKGRPLVVSEKRFELDTFAMLQMEGLIDRGRANYMQGGGIGTKHGLRVVRKGSSNEYEAAKERKDLFVEFSDHQRGLFKKLAGREKAIMEPGYSSLM